MLATDFIKPLPQSYPPHDRPVVCGPKTLTHDHKF